MFCANCGQSVEDGEKFCFHCGKSVVKMETIIPNSIDIKPEMEPASFEASCAIVNKYFPANSSQIKPIQTNAGPTQVLWFMIIFMAASAFTIFLPWFTISSSVDSSLGNASATVSGSPGMIYSWVFILSIGAAIALFFQKKIFIAFGIFASVVNLITGILFITTWKDENFKASAEFSQSQVSAKAGVDSGIGVILLIILSLLFAVLAMIHLSSDYSQTSISNKNTVTAKTLKTKRSNFYKISRYIIFVFLIFLIISVAYGFFNE